MTARARSRARSAWRGRSRWHDGGIWAFIDMPSCKASPGAAVAEAWLDVLDFLVCLLEEFRNQSPGRIEESIKHR